MGEFDLIARLIDGQPPPGERLRVASGDDAAVTEPGDRATATTIDAVVDGVHFELPAFPPEAVGRKALAAALSDLAAMGAEPGEAYVALGVPAELSEEFLLAVGDGLAEAARREGISVAGGDLTAAPVLSLAVCCVGYEPAGGRLVTRSGAEPGDVLAVTGELGGAAGALRALGVGPGPRLGSAEMGAADREALLARQLDPRPRFAAGLALAGAGAKAMIDVSDGLAADAGHLAAASGCAAEIELEALPLCPQLPALLGDERRARELAASGGEDYELAIALAPDRIDPATAATEALGVHLTQVGRISEGRGVTVRDGGGEAVEARGFDHMRGSRSVSGGASGSGVASGSAGSDPSDPASSGSG